MVDEETGEMMWADSGDAGVRDRYKKWYREHQSMLDDLFLRSGVDAVKIRTDQDYVKPLTMLFRKRESRR